MSCGTSGVALIGRILALIASEDAFTAAGLAKELGASRTTVFAVLRGLESAGFVDRDAAGVVAPGPASGALGLACFGIGRAAGAIEALLPVLRDDTDAHVELVVRTDEGETVCAARSPSRGAPSAAPEGRTNPLEAPLGETGAILRLQVGPHAGIGEKAAARASLDAVAAALSRSAASGPHEGAEV